MKFKDLEKLSSVFIDVQGEQFPAVARFALYASEVDEVEIKLYSFSEVFEFSTGAEAFEFLADREIKDLENLNISYTNGLYFYSDHNKLSKTHEWDVHLYSGKVDN